MGEGASKSDWPFEMIGLTLISGASVAGWLMLGSHRAFTGIWAGGLIGMANFKWLGSIVKGALAEGKAAGYTARYLLKFLFIVASSALLIYSRLVDPLAFLVGFTLIVITVSLKGVEMINRS
jgi:hypothetical protein